MRYIIRYQDEPKKHWVNVPPDFKKTYTLQQAQNKIKYYKTIANPKGKFKMEVDK